MDEAAVAFKSSGDQKAYTLKSFDGLSFVVGEAVAFKSKTIQHIVEDGCADNSIPLPNISGDVLAKVIEYCQKHVAFDEEATGKAEADMGKRFEEVVDLDEADSEKHFDQVMAVGKADRGKHSEEVEAWDRDFTKLDLATLFHLIMASNYLDIPQLLDLTCQTVADMIKDKSVEEVREIFNIRNDFTVEEEEEYRRNNKWVFEC